jgi:conjugal transfer/type IV secretion protein DotA/TraY
MNNEGKTAKSDQTSGLTFRSVAGFAILPGIIPRLRGLARALSSFLFIFTQLFGASGLIDRNHPCLRTENIGRYRFADIVGLAAERVVFDKKHLPQTLMFFAILGTLALSILTALVGLAMLVLNIPQAHAQMFSDSNDPAYNSGGDWVYEFLGEVFGDVGLGNIWGGQGAVDRNALLHPILKAMFSTYSMALLVIATVMVIYLIVVMLADAARTGAPFGQNFNATWAPIRLAIAIGLLVPISNGYNGAQLVAFKVSEWGSALATNVWISGLSALGNNANAVGNNLVARMQPTDGYNFMRGIWMAHLCERTTNLVLNEAGESSTIAGVTRVQDGNEKYINYQGRVIDATLAGLSAASVVAAPGLSIGLSLAGAGDYWVLNSDYCGAFKIPEEIQTISLALAGGGNTVTLGYLPRLISQRYKAIYGRYEPQVRTAAVEFAKSVINDKDLSVPKLVASSPNLRNLQMRMISDYRSLLGYECVAAPNGKTMCSYLRGADFDAAARQDGAALFTLLSSGKTFGWAVAGSFMLTLVYANNVISAAVNTPPTIVSMPRAVDAPEIAITSPNPTIEDDAWYEFWGTDADTEREAAKQINGALVKGQQFFNDAPFYPSLIGNFNKKNTFTYIDKASWDAEMKDANERGRYNGASGGMDPLQGVFGPLTRSLFVVQQQDMNPLAVVIAIGSALFYMVGILLAAAAAISVLVGVTAPLDMVMPVVVPMLMGAYMLSVVLPVSLFVNFLFAVIEWVISVFEAVIGMPLWALSFISVGGDGIGDKAMSGVMKLFEIMLRPTIITTVTIAAFIIFSGAVHFFNRAFAMFYESYMDVSTAGGSALMFVGSLFIYVMTVYSVGNSCFKMIPTIANNFMNWIGGSSGFSGTMQAGMTDVDGYAAFKSAMSFGEGLGKVGGAALGKQIGKNNAAGNTARLEGINRKIAGGQSLSSKEQRIHQAMLETEGPNHPNFANLSPEQKSAARARQARAKMDLDDVKR